MHIQIAQKELEFAATTVSSLVDKTGPMPVLGNLLIVAGDDGVIFRGTDVESLVQVKLEAEVVRPGLTTIPADTFKEIVKVLPPQGTVSIEEEGARVTVICDRNKYKLMTLPAQEFPNWPAETGTTRFELPQRIMKDLIESTTYALPGKDHRRVLLGVHFELFDSQLRLTATDGKKLSRIFAPIPEIEGENTASIVVPRKLLDNVAKVLGNEGPVYVEMSRRQIVFRFGDVIYRGNGIEGKYPDCDAVIPKEFPLQVPINRDVFLQGARRAGITTDDRNKSIILKFSENTCEFSSQSHDLGQFSGSIPVEYDGQTIELAFNFQFLIETLGRFDKAEVTMFIKSSGAPVVFRTKDEEHRLCLLMPIKLADARPMPVAAEAAEE